MMKLVAKIGEDLECPMCYDTFKKPSLYAISSLIWIDY